jgi:hypothetical protein
MNNILEFFFEQLAEEVNSHAYFQQDSEPVPTAKNPMKA